MKRTFFLIPIFAMLGSCTVTTENKVAVEEKEEYIVRYDRPDAAILRGVYIPQGKEYFYTSGLVAPVRDENAVAGTYGRYGNTYEQSIGILKRIKDTIGEGNFTMEDVIFLRVYLAPDKDGKIDWDAWFNAYGEFFNNEENPNKVARSTIAVHSLANPELLIEIEAVAAK
ncbi:RidA family protein [Aquiflexum sp. TKW24L]|uniref:RidA family protein n=1 Tax=Aquiflexum sp. TKW24L TaxID=2942212 RepID=UPI0020BE625B|nr:RidA family protein [Aquiflexum sp. TKW24L]MCL6259751.1 RidA family protein [Aquiflexum sp. TKW24L]